MSDRGLSKVVARLKRSVDPLARVSDRDLLTRFLKDRDEAAFEALVRRHERLVRSAIGKVLTDPVDAEDALQATFLVLVRRAKQIDNRPGLGPWLYGVAHRIAVKARATGRTRKKKEAQITPAGATTPTDLSWREACDVLHAELDRLPDTYRNPLLLCYLEGKTRDEAAAALGVTVAALHGRLERGREALRTRLARRGVTLSAGLLTAVAAPPAIGSLPATVFTSVLAAVRGAASARAIALSQETIMLTILSKVAKSAVLMVGLVATTTTLTLGGGRFRADGPAATDPLTPAQSKRAKPMAENKADVKSTEKKKRTITGVVLGADGQPAEGVTLFHPYSNAMLPVALTDIEMEEVGRTDAAGKFHVTLTRSAPRDYLVAHAPGAGVDWVDLSEPAANEVALRLVPDTPIRGRIVTTEGKPAAGVSVTVVSVYVPADEKLDDYLMAWKTDLQQAVATPRKRLYCPLAAVTGSARTDADGRFTITGVGAERIIHLVVEGGGIARQNPMVVTRSGFDPKPYNDQLLEKRHDQLRILNHFRGLNGPDLTLLAESGKTIEGTVTDSQTGEPVVGAGVSSLTGWSDGVSARTDADGKYRLEGIPKREIGYGVSVMAPKESGYINASTSVTDTEGFTPIRRDIKLAKGVIVTGRVTDKQTGKPVTGGVRLAPLPGNKFFGSADGFDSYRINRTMSSIGTDGRFRLTTIPGKALLMAQVHDGTKFHGEHLNPFRRATADPDHKDLFKYDADEDSWSVTTVENSIEFIANQHAVKVIDIPESGETIADLIVDRGVTGRVEVRDPDGKPLSGAYVAGLTDSWPLTYKVPEAGATVYALDPGKPRTLALFHPAKNLAGVATIRGDEKAPVVVTLAAAGTVTGRFIDEDGAPIAGAEITVNAPRRICSELYRFTAKERPRIVTDEKGAFTLPNVVPGMEFYIQTRKGEEFFGGKPKLGKFVLQAGETKALGDRTMERLR